MRCRLRGYETHRVRPGRLAARLRVNVLLVISGQLLRRSSASYFVFSRSSARAFTPHSLLQPLLPRRFYRAVAGDQPSQRQ